jgi:hypothetical protein
VTVAELFDRCLPRLRGAPPPTLTFVDAAQAVQAVLTQRLWEQSSDLLKTVWNSTEQAISTNLVDLPSTFLGVADEDPPAYLTYTAGSATQVAPLYPLSVSRANYLTAEDAIPSEYEIRGSVFEVYPGSSVAFTLYIPMYARPAALTQMSDSLPWNGMHDQLFQDAVSLMAAAGGGFTAAVTPGVDAAIRAALDGGTAIRTGRKVRWLMA